MKAVLYNYRVLDVNRRATVITFDVPPDLEFYFGVLHRKDWAVAQKWGEEIVHPEMIGIVDVMTDIFVVEQREESGESMIDAIRRLAMVDFPILDAKFKAAVEHSPDPIFPEPEGDQP